MRKRDEYSPAEKEELYRQGRQLIRDAYFIDPDDAVANIYMASVSDLDVQQTARYVERALALDPGNIEVLRVSAFFAGSIGRFDDAIILGNRAFVIPHSARIMCEPVFMTKQRLC